MVLKHFCVEYLLRRWVVCAVAPELLEVVTNATAQRAESAKPCC
jgi:hypothetical protein